MTRTSTDVTYPETRVDREVAGAPVISDIPSSDSGEGFAMQTRIYSRAGLKWTASLSLSIAVAATGGESSAADAPGYYTHPDTGIVYRQVTRTVERPVVDTQMTTQERTVFRPQTVTETKPESRTVYSPVVEYQWEPRLQGRWNPFRQPTVAYHHVPVARWEARSEVVARTNTRTEWVAEKQTLEVPQRTVRIERQQQTDFEPVGRVATPGAAPPGSGDQFAARLRPLDNNAAVVPFGSTAPAGTLNRLASDPPRRDIGQGGIPVTELYPSGVGYGQVIAPVNTGTGIATLPALPIWR